MPMPMPNRFPAASAARGHRPGARQPPQLILADEPNRDSTRRRSMEIIGFLHGAQPQTGVTILLVTHENDIAQFAGRLNRFKDGHVVHDGPVVHELAAQ